ncbi:bifunctional tetrahydrofolate synthase/dihydrofolate synthase [Blochmannia endosymbiont of Colobopsis nipponica]|uniref:bifunctional tetrahydrofolate synthase/dihydrofolate synthase n=1 Tax=Blochmannia endosymbiont of Colobopsis nipponica TaxID=2681987 RepID=UPI0017852EDB|nr:bifunctional tetrahydrofolate synthase/dihydrofolate synthase [Blochmannia endosymbiont of Colobopsis nipponica]QOI10971.1 bifunctional tetrahydrofolate synthase/dihydrofolate synthase [Blochmannia endosymbiont of Colobopsis nipponica]
MNIKSTIPKATSSLMRWLNYIQNLHYKNIDLGLDRILIVADRLGLLPISSFIILVGGTNGKGTTCCLLEHILIASGYRVGVYTSPHLLSYTERIRIQGRELPHITHTKVMALIEKNRGSISLSYFEFITLSALQLFKYSQLGVIILEVGVGGRLDATNIVSPNLSIITNVALDHTDLLGSDFISIAKEKSGILRFNKPAIIGEPLQPAILDILSHHGSCLFVKQYNWWYSIGKKDWCWWTSDDILRSLPLPKIPLNNAATVIAALYCLPLSISEKAIHRGLRNTNVLGRFQIVGKHPLIILDVAHNPHAASYLSERLSTVSFTGKLRAVVGMLSNKNIAETLRCLHHLVDIWYCVSLNVPLGSCAAELAAHIKTDSNVLKFPNVDTAWTKVMKDVDVKDCILVFGSFYIVSPVMKLIYFSSL